MPSTRATSSSPVTEAVQVRVKDADPEPDHIEIDIETRDGREGRISFYGDEPTVAEFRIWMDEIFETETPEEEFERYFADTLTNVLHVRGSEHQVPANERVGYRTLAEAAVHDSRRCMVCFHPEPEVTEWEVEEELQRAGLAQARAEYRVVPDRQVQAELQRLGEQLLSQWPAPLKGYGYEFTLVDHPMVNAFAIPGGRIFVTTGLVGALETEAALQAVLAHEIAHVESRHSYRSNKGVRTAEAIGGLLNVFSRTTGNRSVAGIGGLATNGIGNLVLANYGRDREREADMFASVFFARANEGNEGLAGTFEALRDAEEASPPSESRGMVTDAVDNVIGRMLASHPSVTERLERGAGHGYGGVPRDRRVPRRAAQRRAGRDAAVRAAAGVRRRAERAGEHHYHRGARAQGQRQRHRPANGKRQADPPRRADRRGGREERQRLVALLDERRRRPDRGTDHGVVTEAAQRGSLGTREEVEPRTPIGPADSQDQATGERQRPLAADARVPRTTRDVRRDRPFAGSA